MSAALSGSPHSNTRSSGQVIVGPVHGVPAQPPPLQVSFTVQGSPSSQESVLLVCTQPVAASHESVVQGLLSLQSSGVPAVQVPFWQVSAPLQALPSEQEVPLATAVCETEPLALQVSVVQALPSSMVVSVPSAGLQH